MRAKLLHCPGWLEATRQALERLILAGGGRKLPVVFDFDNTLVHGDVGEATLAILARSGRLAPSRLAKGLCPPFRPPGGGEIRLEECSDVTEYYEAFLAPTVHGKKDPNPLANGYAWVVEIMAGLTPLEVIEATRAAYEMGEAGQCQLIDVTPGKTAFPAPYFHPEMVELLGVLLEHDFDIWIISASNVWSVRWMVLEKLNPMLRRAGLRRGLRSDHIIGISTLLTDETNQLHKDALLVRDRPGYAALEPEALAAFRLTCHPQFPVPAYSGKIAALFDAVGQPPYLSAGDSPGDHSLLKFSQYRLWLARLNKPGYQESTRNLIRQTGPSGWLIQPTLSHASPGFISCASDLAQKLKPMPTEVKRSLRFLSLWLRLQDPGPTKAKGTRPEKRLVDTLGPSPS